MAKVNSVQPKRIGLALQGAEFVVADVGILGCVGDVAALGQPGGKGMVRALFLFDHVLRPSLRDPCWQTTTGRCSPGGMSLGTSRMP